jgi:hypothetical protein
MVFGYSGKVDLVEEGFVVQFDYSPEIVARMKAIQRRRFERDRLRWVVECHWPSVHRLFQIALDYGFHVSASARAEEQRLRRESYELEYAIDAVHDHGGAMWFVCKTGDDDDVRHKVRDIRGAYWDDSWWVPTDWESCCGPLREIVESDERFVLSNAAAQLLYEEDVTDRYLRSGVPVGERIAPPQPVSLRAVESERAEPAGSVRKPRVTAHGAQPAGEPATDEKHSA